MKTSIIFVTSLCVIYSCGSIKPEPPENKDKTLELKEIPTVVSSLNIPLEVDMLPFIGMADKLVDKSFNGSDKPCEGLRYEYKLNRSSFQFDGRGVGKIGLGLDLQYGARGEFCALCMGNSCSVPEVSFQIGFTEPMKRARIEVESKIKVLPDYKLQSNTTITSLKPIDPIKIMFGFDVTNMLLKQAKPFLSEATKAIDMEVSKVDLKKFISPVFDEMQKDIYIPQVGYLAFQTKDLSLSELNFDKNILKFNLGIKATTMIKSSPWNLPKTTLPKLSEYKPSNGFNVITDLKIDYDSISIQIMEALKGKKFDVGKNFIIINHLKLFPAQEKLGIEVSFEGSKKGTLFLTGIPEFNNTTNVLKMNNLQYDLSTKNILLKSAKWLLNETIRKKMEQSMVVDLTPQIEDLKKTMNSALNQTLNKNIRLEGTVKSININTLQSRSEEIFVRAIINGNIAVKVK